MRLSGFSFLFPLDRPRRLARYIVHHAVDVRHLAYDALGHAAQHRIRQLPPLDGHGVGRSDAAHAYDVIVRAKSPITPTVCMPVKTVKYCHTFAQGRRGELGRSI